MSFLVDTTDINQSKRKKKKNQQIEQATENVYSYQPFIVNSEYNIFINPGMKYAAIWVETILCVANSVSPYLATRCRGRGPLTHGRTRQLYPQVPRTKEN